MDPTAIYKPRLTIEVTPEQYNKLKSYLEYGLQRKVFSAIIDDMIDMLDEFGNTFIMALLHKQVTYRGFMVNYDTERPGNETVEPTNPRGTE